MEKCDCYIEDRYLVDYTPLMKPLYKTISLCFGTKEREECTCGGDRTKCNFYPEVREKAKNEIKVATHADNIRSMTDEHLAEYLVDIGWDCCFCSEHDRLENEPLLRGEKCDEQCVKHCLEWLQKTAK